MKRLFIDNIISNDLENVIISGNDYHHLTRSLRTKVGEMFLITDSNNIEFKCKITSINKEQILLTVIEKIKSFTSNIKSHLYLPMLKGDNTELILQKCTEIGIDYFIPYISERSIIKSTDIKSNKILRFNSIVKEASMQCGRPYIPKILPCVKLNEIPIIEKESIGFFFDINGNLLTESITNIQSNNCVYLIVGPEGDFSLNEIDLLINKGFIQSKLTPYVLRSETACIVSSSILLMHL